MEIEPDGQQFLNASAASAENGAAEGENGADGPAPPPPPPPDAATTRTTIVVVAVVIAVLAIGGVAFLTLTGDDEGRRELETGDAEGVDIRDRAEQTTTTERSPETTVPPTTAAPTDDGVSPFPDFGPPPPGVQPGAPTPAPGAQTTCPGGGIATQVVSTSVTQRSASSIDLEVKGTAVNNTTAPVVLEIMLTISHNGNNHPNPWVSTVIQSQPTLAPGETSTWTFSGHIGGGNSANATAIGGGFRWADPSLAACPTQ